VRPSDAGRLKRQCFKYSRFPRGAASARLELAWLRVFPLQGCDAPAVTLYPPPRF
jgi:hypothetical protein